MPTHAEAISLVPKPQGTEIVHHKNGITDDIISSILQVYQAHKGQVSAFAQLFRSADIGTVIDKIHAYIRQNIRYKLDDKGQQLIRRPADIVHNQTADCKGYSILAGAILDSLGIPFAFRFVSYKEDKPFTHVYIVVGQDKTPLDACLLGARTQTKFIKKLDLYPDMTRIAEIGRIGCAHKAGKGGCNSCSCSKPKPVVANKGRFYTFKIDDKIGMNPYEDEIAEVGRRNNLLKRVVDVAKMTPVAQYAKGVVNVARKVRRGIGENPYEEEIAGVHVGLFKKKEGGTKAGNFLRKNAGNLSNVLNKASNIVQALPIPGANLASKIMKVGGKAFNVIDKVSKLPKAIPLDEVIDSTSDKVDELYNRALDPTGTIILPTNRQQTNTNTNTNDKPAKSGSGMMLPLAAAAIAFSVFGGKKRRGK